MGPLVVMGVSGCGKTSVGKLIASGLGYTFIEGDSRHPAANVEKMRSGIALTDADRWPWLEMLGDELARNEATVISCSALKRSYRDLLREKAGGHIEHQAKDQAKGPAGGHSGRPLTFVFLQGERSLLASRMAGRRHDYMPLSLLDSQLATLELPAGGPGGERDIVTIEIDQPPERIASLAIARIATLWQRAAQHNI